MNEGTTRLCCLEAHNLHLGLVMVVNSFGPLSTPLSTWPVVLVNYNIPPWLIFKKVHLLLALLVPSTYKAKNMDVYMAPLIKELQTLWMGIEVFDILRAPP